MSIWKRPMDLAILNSTSRNTLMEALNIEYCQYTDDSLTASMPVNSTVHQPLRMLHGGASVALAESVASIAANWCVDESKYCVGLDINANHIRAVREGTVYATAKPMHLGAITQVWLIDIRDQRERLVCTSRFTVAVMKKKK
ncbi:hotdog fold thioesterase [Aliivibrio sifiae]|uniref:Esterase n=1 Tax=Aliivibrio sifiae TaxID=566293 RepID=A0A2S7X855_9GAMM|nr:hotdog fold thioesterase [Aliivibrio sifiae]PQJ87530.1 esterase [Aliivibrio sifiae]GLR73131.1 esterase [Aliivibrio sifiae]